MSDDSDADFRLLRARYNAAFEAHYFLLTRNTELAKSGQLPTLDELDEEKAALETLAAARRAMLDALTEPPPSSAR